ncbi:MAG: 2-C-methyl-D-erythritol 4-phosphate cytidylyltransferase [Gammaproteobacteria bacterium]|nr:2-C-methyl-D-erythritol 4-phosphate cytidylyltransferase [Gammaproteobacteria bacterium]
MNYWAIIPAAGVGKRMQSNCPKQYLLLDQFSILHHTLCTFIKHPKITGIVVAISEGDEYWPDVYKQLPINDKTILIAPGGNERSDSVLSALNFLSKYLNSSNLDLTNKIPHSLPLPKDVKGDNCIAMVHDAARPCLLAQDIDNLINELDNHEVGVILGLPVVDTLKRCNASEEIETTIDRKNMWRALTPQCFPLDLLIKALGNAYQQGLEKKITDESSAIELMGLKPGIIEGDIHNIKVTIPQDLELAKNFINRQNK